MSYTAISCCMDSPNCDFLFHACYVPNVVKRSIWDQCNIDNRLTTNLRSWNSLPGRNSNGYISTTNHGIHFRFGSRVELSELANLTVPFIFTPNWPLLPSQQNLGQNGLQLGFCKTYLQIFWVYKRVFWVAPSNTAIHIFPQPTPVAMRQNLGQNRL